MHVDAQPAHLRPLAAVMLVALIGSIYPRPAQATDRVMRVSPASPRAEAAKAETRIVQNYGHLPLQFEANKGQADKTVKYLSRGSNYAVYLTGKDAVLALSKTVSQAESRTDVLEMQLTGANTDAKPEGLNLLPGTANYLMGDDPSQWHTSIPTYSQVRYSSVYAGVDLVYYGNQQKLEYDFVVAPNADPNRIRLHFAGAKALSLDASGDLRITTKDGAVAFDKPVVYQLIKDRAGRESRRQTVAGEFVVLADNSVGFVLGKYDRSSALVIDPTLVYSTFLGGSYSDTMNAIAVDSSGAAYLTGTTGSADYPVTPGVFQKSASTAFVTKLNSSGTAIVYSSFLGGSTASTGGNTGADIAVDSSGDAFIVGTTYSSNFPVTAGAFQTKNNAAAASGSNGFVAKVNPSGTALLYSTYLGGSTADGALSLVIDPAGDAYVAGYSLSTNFPTTKGAYQTTNKSAPDYGWNQFVTKLNPTGTALVYSTYIGGSGDYSSPSGIQVAIDGKGDAYVAGTALSADFPTTKGAYQTMNKGKSGHSNITLAEFNPTGTALVYSTYFGGSGSPYGDDTPNGLAIDSLGNAYFSGSTWETDLPVTSGAYQKSSTAVANYLSSAFVTKMNSAGSALVFSTYLGGSSADRGYRLAIDSAGDVYVTGSAGSTNFPVTSNAYQATNAAAFNNGAVVFLTEFNPTGSGLLYSTYMGGSNSYLDTGYGIALGASGRVYLAGIATGSDFPITPGAYKTVFDSQNFTTGFVAEFYLGTGAPPAASETSLTSNANPAIAGGNVTFTASVTPSTGTAIPTGNVVFSIDEAKVATVALNSKGWATYTTTSPLALGQHAVLATYQGSATYSTSGGNITEIISPDTPKITPAGGVFTAAQVVTISDGTPNSVLYYTIDGTVPSASSTKYSGPITVSVNETLRVIGILPNASSAEAFATYSLVGAPYVLAVPASAITTPKATLNALVNTYGMSGTCYFRYGTSGTSLASSSVQIVLPGSGVRGRLGVAPVPVSATLTSLTAKTTYYYQVVVATAAGASAGDVLSFTTN